jgi:anti-sigma factor ChrR (cupin superfamily)
VLGRVGGEFARATSIVRYAPDSRFSAHRHGGGEEFLVLDGVFSDTSGDYAAGSYVRNPPGSDHAPWTHRGCVIFVKLRQMDDTESVHVVVAAEDGLWQALDAHGARRKLLYASPQAREVVALEELPANYEGADETCPHGEELLVLDGTLEDEHGRYASGIWVRNPAGFRRRLRSPGGARYWVKRGHLPPPI